MTTTVGIPKSLILSDIEARVDQDRIGPKRERSKSCELLARRSESG
jgi:hypothetical protein